MTVMLYGGPHDGMRVAVYDGAAFVFVRIPIRPIVYSSDTPRVNFSRSRYVVTADRTWAVYDGEESAAA